MIVVKLEWLCLMPCDANLIAKNVKGTGCKRSKYYVHGNKKEALERIIGEKFDTCSNKNCSNKAYVSAHIVIKGLNRICLTPLCRKCNNPIRDDFKLRVGSYIIPLLFVKTSSPNQCIFNTMYDTPLQKPLNPQKSYNQLKKRILI